MLKGFTAGNGISVHRLAKRRMPGFVCNQVILVVLREAGINCFVHESWYGIQFAW